MFLRLVGAIYRTINMNEDKRIVLCTFLISTALCIIACVLILSVKDWAVRTTQMEYEQTEAQLHEDEVFMNHGYVQKLLPGSTVLIWEKEDSIK